MHENAAISETVLSTNPVALDRQRARMQHAEAVERAWAQFVAFLRDKSARVTQSRKIILDAALARDDHFRADQLAASLSSGPNRVSRGTVYRTLALLVEAGMLREIRDADTHVHYEPTFERLRHEHMICDQCGQFIEFVDPALSRQIVAACRQYNFNQRMHRVVVFGTCRDCAS